MKAASLAGARELAAELRDLYRAAHGPEIRVSWPGLITTGGEFLILKQDHYYVVASVPLAEGEDMMTEIEWGSPGEAGHGRRRVRSKYQDFADELKARPGEWAVAREWPAEGARSAYSFAVAVNLGRMRVWQPAGAFEGSARSADGKTRVHVRYVGTGGEQ